MKLQLAIDLLDQKEAAKLAQEVEEFIDIVEIGTPIVINEGLSAVEHMSKSVTNTQVLADLKIMDAASYEVSQAVKLGADIVTILVFLKMLQLKVLSKKHITMVKNY